MATWTLDPQTTHLNHGSFGATPAEVLVYQHELRAEMEANPVGFMLRTYQPLLEQSRDAVASFVGADPAGLVFVPNATYGVNSILRSLEPHLRPGSEIIVTSHTYNACRNAAQETANRVDGSLIVADIPFPIAGPAEAAQAVLDAVTPRTRLVLLDHVTSATGLVLPIEEITADLEPDVMVLVDGAHGPGMVEVDLTSLGASFYTANCHKWMCAPKGAAFLWVAERHRSITRAASISHGYNGEWPSSGSAFHAQFDWTGTDDPTARLSVPKALSVMASHRSDGWAGIRASNHGLVLEGRQIIASALGAPIPVPDSMIGSLASLVLRSPALDNAAIEGLNELLHRSWRVEVPVIPWPTQAQWLLRISAQQYNRIEDYERLAEALTAELGPQI